MTTVAILGGGMAGLAAAHELAHRGFTVDVYELSSDLGGKSASQPVAGLPPATGGRRDLLGEHGFRFFPGFYQNVIATMSEIPRPPAHGGGVVADDLVSSPQAAMAYPPGAGGDRFYPFDRVPSLPPWDMYNRLRNLVGGLGFTDVDVARMAWFRLKYLTAGPSRRLRWDGMSWFDFIELSSPHYSPGCRDFEISIPRTMSAMAASTTSAMIVGNIGMQFGLGYMRPGNQEDRLLVGPTNYRWLEPWRTYLAGLPNVTFHTQFELTGLTYVGGSLHISGASLIDHNPMVPTPVTITPDYYIVALPLERAQPLITLPMAADDPQLATFLTIGVGTATSWMAGAQFYLRNDVPMVPGHVFFPQSPWALTCVSQAQFWNQSGTNVEDAYGDGTVKGVLSAIISDWTTPSPYTGLAAKDYQAVNRSLLLEEVRRQLQESLPASFDLSVANIAAMHLDDHIQLRPNPPPTPPDSVNLSPLLIHPVNGYQARPLPQGAIDNLFLAADYVRTSTGLATMEGANEAARMAVNALLAVAPGSHMPCPIWTLQEDPFFDPLKEIDELRLASNLPHVFDSCPIAFLGDVGLIDWLQEVIRFPAVLLLPG